MARHKCPRCGSRDNATMLFGLPAGSDELQRDLKRGRIDLGGCVVSPTDPRWHCNNCDAYFGLYGERAPHFSIVEPSGDSCDVWKSAAPTLPPGSVMAP